MFTLSFVVGVVLHNLECMPRPAVISTSRIEAEYFPYFVNLHRCEGSQNKTPPLLKKCVADKEEKLTISAESITTGRRVELVVVNHTSCKAECAGNRNECKPPAHFDEQSCKCICDLGINGPDEKRCSDPRKEYVFMHLKTTVSPRISTRGLICKNELLGEGSFEGGLFHSLAFSSKLKK